MDTRLVADSVSRLEVPRRYSRTLLGCVGPATGRRRGLWLARQRTGDRFPPFCHDGTERPIGRPTDDLEQESCFSGKKKRHTVKNLLLIDQALTVVFLSPTYDGTVHDKRIADENPYCLPPKSHLLQDLGFVGFTLEGVHMIMPHKKPRGQELTLEQKTENRGISQRRVRIEHVNSSVKRCRIVKDTIRLIKEGVRDIVMEVCCALHNFRLRLTPWQPLT